MQSRVTEQDVKTILANSEFQGTVLFGKMLILACKLPSGFVIVASSGSMYEYNFDEKYGEEVCLKKIEDEVWKLEAHFLSKIIDGIEKGNCQMVEDLSSRKVEE